MHNRGSKCSSSVQATVHTVINNDSSHTGMSDQPGVPACTGIDGDMTSRNLGQQPGNPHPGIFSSTETQSGVEWASTAATSSPVVHGNRFSVAYLHLLMMINEMLNRSRSIGQGEVLNVNAKLRISLSCLGLNSRHNTQLISSAPRNVVSAETD